MPCVQRSLALTFALLAILVSWSAPGAAQIFGRPRTVRFILPLGAGSGSDIGARLLADRLSKRWGQPVVIENRPGGDGILAVSAFVGARDDHILLFSPTSSFAAHVYIHESLPYKPDDLVPIARVSNTLISVAVPIGSPVNSLADLIAAAKAEPGKLNWAGVTGAHDFGFAGFLKTVGAEMTKVPYRNTVEAANDLAQGRVQVFQAAVAIVQPQLLPRQDQADRDLQQRALSDRAGSPDRRRAGLSVAADRRLDRYLSDRRGCRSSFASGSPPTFKR